MSTRPNHFLTLKAALDAINQRLGRGTVRFLGEGLEQRWLTQAKRRSSRYTTRFQKYKAGFMIDEELRA